MVCSPGIRVPEMRKNQQYLGATVDDDKSSTEDLNSANLANTN